VADFKRGRAGVLALVLLGVAGPAVAAETEIFRDWTAQCDSAGICILSQASLASGDRLLALSRLSPDAEDGAVLEIAVPAGVHLASGLFVAAGKPAPKALDWVRCGEGLCLATARLDRTELSAWRRANTAELRYRPELGGKVIGLKISLMGLTAALRHAERRAERAQ
jgi:invasion protein IalB